MISKQTNPKSINVSLIDQNRAPEIYALLKRLVKKHRSDLVDVPIALAWRKGWKPDADGHVRLGQCKKATDLEREFHDYCFVILLNEEMWSSADFTEAQQAALLHHELTHAELKMDPDTGEQVLDERGRPVGRIRRHDVEEFLDVVRVHGVWTSELAELAKVAVESKKTPLLPVEQ